MAQLPVTLSGINTGLDVVGLSTPVRPLLTANTTYYVSSSAGSNVTGDGSAGNPWATVQFAIEFLKTIDGNGVDVTIQIADGTYVPESFGIVATFDTTLVGIHKVILLGNTSTPSNVLFNLTGAGRSFGIYFGLAAANTVRVDGIKIAGIGGGPSGATCMFGIGPSLCDIGAVDFGAVDGNHVHVSNGYWSVISGAYTISGGAISHILLDGMGFWDSESSTITLTGTPNFSNSFLQGNSALYFSESDTFVGSATGNRFNLENNCDVKVLGHANNLIALPGNTGGIITGNASYNDITAQSIGLLQVYLIANQTVTAQVDTKIHFDTVVIDRSGWYDNITNFRYTPLIQGYYSVTVAVFTTGANFDSCQAKVRLNGNQVAGGSYVPANGTGTVNSTVTAITYCNGSSDYIEGFAYCPNTTITAGATATYMNIYKVSD